MSNAEISAIGLCLDIVGVLLLWRFGLPPNVRRGGVITLALEQTDKCEKRKAACYDRISDAAIGLVVLGFAMQLIGTMSLYNASGNTQAVQVKSTSSKPVNSAKQPKY